MYDLAVGRMSSKPRSSLPGFHDGERWISLPDPEGCAAFPSDIYAASAGSSSAPFTESGRTAAEARPSLRWFYEQMVAAGKLEPEGVRSYTPRRSRSFAAPCRAVPTEMTWPSPGLSMAAKT